MHVSINIRAIPVGINENRHLVQCSSNCNRKAITVGNDIRQYWIKQPMQTQ